jgi:hypothetical protein
MDVDKADVYRSHVQYNGSLWSKLKFFLSRQPFLGIGNFFFSSSREHLPVAAIVYEDLRRTRQCDVHDLPGRDREAMHIVWQTKPRRTLDVVR